MLDRKFLTLNIHHRAGPLRHRCELCKMEPLGEDALQCQGCKIVRYCCEAHKNWHADQHINLCEVIQNLRADKRAFSKEVASVLKDNMGRLWMVEFARGYMESCQTLCNYLHQSGTLDGVRKALAGMSKILQMSRKDETCLRDSIACLMLQLDKDQECYDFVKWWELRLSSTTAYDWHDVKLPYLNRIGSDVLSSISFLDKDRTSLVFLAAMLLLKLKLVIDVKNIILTRNFLRRQSTISEDIIEMIAFEVIRSPISRRFVRMLDEELESVKDTLSAHVVQLGKAIARKSKLFTKVLVHHERFLEKPEELLPKKMMQNVFELVYQGGSGLENEEHDTLVTAFHTVYPAFYQTGQAFSMLKLTNDLAQRYNSGGSLHDMWAFFPTALNEACGIAPPKNLAWRELNLR